jgi:hypothetical protein
MYADDPWTRLPGLGLTHERGRSLLFLPLAYVATNSRRIDLRALDALLRRGAVEASLDMEDVGPAKRWLRQPPTLEQFRDGFELLRELSLEPDESLFSVRDVLESLVWACSAAQLDRERLQHGYTPVSSSARAAVRDVEEWLGLEVGDLWSDVMAELGDELPRSRNMMPPHFQTSPESSRGPSLDSLEGSLELDSARRTESGIVPTHAALETSLEASLAALPDPELAPEAAIEAPAIEALEEPEPESIPFPLVQLAPRRSNVVPKAPGRHRARTLPFPGLAAAASSGLTKPNTPTR